MKIISPKTIKATRGERGTIRLKLKDGNTFNVGDKIKVSVVEKMNYNNVLMQKEFSVAEESEYAYLTFTKEDMTFGDIKSGQKEYRYEIELNNEKPLIGAKDDEENIFLLCAEAGDK